MTLLHHALNYAKKGLEIFPCKPTKEPYTTNGMKSATSNLARVQHWWEEHPDALIGARIPEGVMVLDFDPRHGGLETWNALKAEFGPITGRTHYSGRDDGGFHLWCIRPEGRLTIKALDGWAQAKGVGAFVNDSKRWSCGVDILHRNLRYTILPPSIHKDSGKPYFWQDPTAPYAVLPEGLIDLLVADEPEHEPEPTPERPKLTLITGSGYAPEESIADWFSATRSWREILEPYGWTCVQGDGDSDGSVWRHPAASTSKSATVRHGCLFVYSTNTPFEPTEDGDPRGYTRFAAYAKLAHGDDQSAAARAAREMKDGPRPAINRTQPGKPEDEPDELLEQLIKWGEFWDDDHGDVEWLIEPILPAKRSIAIFAPGGTGKSLLALWLAAGLATGKRMFGQHPEPVDVLYLDYEMTPDDLAERLDSMGYGPDSDLSKLHYALLPTLPPLDTPEGGLAVARLADLVGARLVVLDTLSRAVQGPENEADTVRALYRNTGQLLKKAGRAFLRIDHAGKDLDKGQRGTSAKNDDVDVVWRFTRQEAGAFKLVASKKRMGWIEQKVELSLTDEPLLEYRVTSAGSTYPDGTKELAEEMDRLGLPINISIRKAQEALRGLGTGRRRSLIGAAIRWRKEAQPAFTGPGNRSGNHLSAVPGNRSAEPPGTTKAKHLVTGLGTTLGTAGNHPPSPTGNHRVPPKGDPGSQGQVCDTTDTCAKLSSEEGSMPAEDDFDYGF